MQDGPEPPAPGSFRAPPPPPGLLPVLPATRSARPGALRPRCAGMGGRTRNPPCWAGRSDPPLHPLPFWRGGDPPCPLGEDPKPELPGEMGLWGTKHSRAVPCAFPKIVPLTSLFLFYSPPPPQEVWYQMRRLLPRHLPQRPGPESAEQSVPPELFHLHGLQQAALHGRGTLYHRREQICLQRGLFELPHPEGRQPQLRYAPRGLGDTEGDASRAGAHPGAGVFLSGPAFPPWSRVGMGARCLLSPRRSPRMLVVPPHARPPPRFTPSPPPTPHRECARCPPRRGPDPSPPFTQRQSSHLTSLEAVSAAGRQDQARSCCPSNASRPCSPPSVGSLSVQHPGPDPATPVSGAAAASEASRAWPGGVLASGTPGGAVRGRLGGEGCEPGSRQ